MIADRMLSATYRVQLHKDFGFARVRELAEYLHRLGVSHVYSSPILRARPGSTHGYDVADPTEANPELGGEAERIAMVDALHERDLGLILDIVPNHMGTGPANPYWQDVLAHGRGSAYAKWFDVEWEAPSRTAPGQLLLPVLGDERESALARGEIGLALADGAIEIAYFENRFPTDPATLPRVLRDAGEGSGMGDEDREALRTILETLEHLPTRDEEGQQDRRRYADEARRRLRDLTARSAEVRAHIERRVAEFAKGADAVDRMREFLDAQPYRLRFWRLGPRDLNYRRFFDINELVALRMEDPEVFAETHERILAWIADESLDGVRIDHIDGLLDPRRYLDRLRAAIRARGRDGDAETFPIWVEKILSPGEHLRGDWPVEGTTGYEFLNDLEAIFIDPVGHACITRLYAGLTGLPDFGELAHRGKMRVLQRSLASDVSRLARLLAPLAEAGRRTRGLGRGELREALVELIACLPVYRTYIDPVTGELSAEDRAVIERAARRAVEGGRVALEAVELLRRAMLHPDRAVVDTGTLGVTDDIEVPDEPGVHEEEMRDLREDALRFTARFQQTSGPATAKGVEDTALYLHYPLASLNEVGGEPERPLERAVAILHEANAERARDWPCALICTNTHDTKRSADVRARLDVLSEIPDRWERAVLHWRRLNRTLRTRVRDRMAPDANTEYLFYQTLVGVWPLPGAQPPGADALKDLRERVAQYMLKAVREAKRHTSWTDPDEAFEGALRSFVDRVLDAGPASPFLREVDALVREISRSGLWNALSRALVHLTAPGTPDIYQGDELWNFALVDPDNRRPVDYEHRARVLADLEGMFRVEGATPVELVQDMVAHVEDGRLKLYTMWRALQCRRGRAKFFLGANYEPLEAAGRRARNLFAFARPADRKAAVVVATRLLHGTTAASGAPVGSEVWGDTRLRLPARSDARRWRCQLSSEVVDTEEDADGRWLDLGRTLRLLPVALLFPD